MKQYQKILLVIIIIASLGWFIFFLEYNRPFSLTSGCGDIGIKTINNQNIEDESLNHPATLILMKYKLTRQFIRLPFKVNAEDIKLTMTYFDGICLNDNEIMLRFMRIDVFMDRFKRLAVYVDDGNDPDFYWIEDPEAFIREINDLISKN